VGPEVSLSSLTFGYGPLRIFDGLTTAVVPAADGARVGGGRIAVVMGPSGCGKTTLLRLILGQERPLFGSVVIEPSGARVSYLSQDPVLFDHLSIETNARYFERLTSTRGAFDGGLYRRAASELHLEPILHRSGGVGTLSGGERQRIALLRALSIRPRLLLLDEPCRGLDASARQEFMSHLRMLTDELGLSVVYVTHSHVEARFLADRLLFLIKPSADPVKVAAGSLEDVIVNPRHESIMTAFCDDPISRIRASLTGDVVSLLGGTLRCQRAGRGGVGPVRSGVLLLPASGIRWSRSRGLSFRRLSRTGQYALASFSESDPSNDLVIGLAAASDTARLYIHGEAMLFGDDGYLLETIRMVEPS